MKKRLPKLKSDTDAERFLAQDLSPYIHQGNFKLISFEYAPKNKTVSLRLSDGLLSAIKALSKRRGIPYQRYIRETLEFSIRNNSTAPIPSGH